MSEAERDRRQRLDTLLVERGLAPTRARAQALILAGRVFRGAERLDKPGLRLPPAAALEVREGARFVSRGGEKLAHALEALGVDISGRDALDVGASTGGFTQVLLERGARRVIALDVGRGQLDWTLRGDARVVVVEGLNARYLTPSLLPLVPALAVVDVSFISLKRILPAVVPCLAPPGEIVALIKPQFEVGRGRVGRGGIVHEPALHREVLLDLVGFALARGWGLLGLLPSPIRGAEGNREFFIHLSPDGAGLDESARAARIRAAVEPAEGER